MKTYKQMAENVLKRRDEYFEQKQDRKASRGVISAAVAACAVVVVILFGTIIGGVMKSPVTTPETDAPPAASSPGSTDLMTDETETAPEDTDDTEREATAEITEETAEEETQADEDSESESTMHSNISTEEETPAENLSEETIPDNFTESDTVTERSDNTDSETEKTDTDNNGTEETEQYAVRRDNYYVIKNYQYDYDYSKTSTRMYLYDVMDDNVVYHDNITKADMLVKQHQDILEYKFEVYDDRSSNPGGVENWNDPDDKWVICFVVDENIELISPACGYAFYDRGNDQRPDEDAWHQTIDLKFRFKDGKTNGTISIYAVVGEKSVQQFVEHKMEFNAEDGYWLQMHDYSFATVKGYDFRGGGYIDDLYHWAAVCFGDVDNSGWPLYYEDPYMLDYYDNPWCESARIRENEQNDIYIRPVDYIPEPNAPITVNMGIDGVMYGYECREVMTYTFKYNFYKYKEKIGDLHGQHVRVIVTHNDRIELISPEIFTLDIPDGTATFNIEFRYKDEATNGKFVMYFIEDLYEDIDKYNSVDYVEQIKDEYSFRSVSQLLECCAARTKGYDFFKAGTSSNNRMYGSIAHYFGDVDENGVPLYRYDPYMPDYYDCDECISKRKQIERDLKNQEEFFSTYEEFFSTYNSMSRDNNIYIDRYIKRTDKEGNLKPERYLFIIT